MSEFTMPSLGADMDSGTVSKWLIDPGATVHRGDVVAEVETDKSTIEVEIFEDGVIGELLVPEGQRVPVGTALATVEPMTGDRQRPHGTTTTRQVAPAATPPVAPIDRRPAAAPPALGGPEVTLSPVVRQLAAAHEVDVRALRGTGPGGTVTRADVEEAVGAGRARPPDRTRARSSPAARRRAAELGMDVGIIDGSGPNGSVLLGDVERTAARGSAAGPAAPRRAPAQTVQAVQATGDRGVVTTHEQGTATVAPAGADGARRQAAALRRSIGELMARAKREIPHYYLSTTIDAEPTMGWLERVNLDRPVADRLVVAAPLLKATALAVHRVPEVNGHFLDGELAPSSSVHVGIAVSLRRGGVLAPAIHDLDELPLDEVMRQLTDVVTRARSGRLRSSEMSDPTITVTNLGDLGVDQVFGVIYPPQVALVGFGRIGYRPQAKDGMVGVRRCVTATLSADHRASDGHRGGRYLAEIDRLLQEPEKL